MEDLLLRGASVHRARAGQCLAYPGVPERRRPIDRRDVVTGLQVGRDPVVAMSGHRALVKVEVAPGGGGARSGEQVKQVAADLDKARGKGDRIVRYDFRRSWPCNVDAKVHTRQR